MRRGPLQSWLTASQPLLRFDPTALEQPVPHAEVIALAELRPRLGVPVMLDESLCGFPDAVAAVRTADGRSFERPAVEVRRHIPSLRIIGLAQRSGLGVQLGCHPGETCAAFGRGTARRQPRRRSSICRGLVRPAHSGRQFDDVRISPSAMEAVLDQ